VAWSFRGVVVKLWVVLLAQLLMASTVKDQTDLRDAAPGVPTTFHHWLLTEEVAQLLPPPTDGRSGVAPSGWQCSSYYVSGSWWHSSNSGAGSPVRSHGGSLLTKNRLRWFLRKEKKEGGGRRGMESCEIGRKPVKAVTLARGMSSSACFSRITLSCI
jgi:hypothetical protein